MTALICADAKYPPICSATSLPRRVGQRHAESGDLLSAVDSAAGYGASSERDPRPGQGPGCRRDSRATLERSQAFERDERRRREQADAIAGFAAAVTELKGWLVTYRFRSQRDPGGEEPESYGS